MPGLRDEHDLVAVRTLKEPAEQLLGGATGIPVRGVDERAARGTERREEVPGILGGGPRAPRHRPQAQPRDGQSRGPEAAGEHGGDPIGRPLATVGAMRLAITCGYAGMGLGTDTLELVREAERLGYAQAWVAEAYGSDAPTVLAWLGAQTSTIGLGAGVMQIPARTPAMTAMTAATLDTLTGGRFHLGLGVSGPQVSEGWHGVRFGAPLARTREYVEIVRMALRREQVLYEGEHFTLPLPDGPGKALRLTLRPPRADLPVYLAAVGPRNLRLAGEVADGWLAVFLSPEHCADQLDAVRAGRASRTADAVPRGADADPLDDFDVVATVPVVVTDDLEAARAAVADYTALYIGGMGSRDANFYNALARRMGFDEAADTIQDLYLAGRPRDAADAVPFDLVDSTALIGPPERIAERIGRYADAGVTTLSVAPYAESTAERAAVLHTVADALRRSAG